MTILEPGGIVPHFEVTALDGRTVRYSTIWQRRMLVLIALPDAGQPGTDEYLSTLSASAPAFRDLETECVITRDVVPGLDAPGALIADQWGEIVFVVSEGAVVDLPPARELLEWAEHVRHRCPECEGEAR
jgi:hypothetical protein